MVWFGLSTGRQQEVLETHLLSLPVQLGSPVRKCHLPDSWSIDKYQPFLSGVQALQLEEEFCLHIDLYPSEIIPQWRIMSFYIYSVLHFWFFCSKISRITKTFSFLTFALHEKNLFKDRNHGADIPSSAILYSASSSFLPWHISLHCLIVSTVPSFANECMLLMRLNDGQVSSLRMQMFPLHWSLFPTVCWVLVLVGWLVCFFVCLLVCLFFPAVPIPLQRC